MSIVDRFFEQFSDWRFVDERTPQNAKYIKHASVKAAIVLCNSHKAIGAYSAVYLYPNRIFGITPKCFDVKMLLNLFEKQLHLPTLFVKHCNIFCAYVERIGNIYINLRLNSLE